MTIAPDAAEGRASLEPGRKLSRARRRRLPLSGEFALALMPTATILVVLAVVEALTQQRLLFASLASSAFLIYLDPEHGTNRIRTLVIAQGTAALSGAALYGLLGSSYGAAGGAMIVTIVLMIALDAMHPPAVATAMAFGLRTDDASNVLLFGLALGITAVLVLLQRVALWTLTHMRPRNEASTSEDKTPHGHPPRQ
jgi:CBS-domain-containing membrane protein